MPIPRPDLVLIDLDGTLVDSAPDLAFSINSMLMELDLAPHPEATVREWIGSGAERLVKRALTSTLCGEPEAALYERAFKLFTDIYVQNICRRTALCPGVREGLDYLLGTGRQVGIVTNKRHRFTIPLLEGLGVLQDFAIVISGDTLPVKKPDPQPLLHAATRLAVAPHLTVMVGDSINDVEAARRAGMAVVCVRNGYNNGEDIACCKPDVIVDTLAELRDYI